MNIPNRFGLLRTIAAVQLAWCPHSAPGEDRPPDVGSPGVPASVPASPETMIREAAELLIEGYYDRAVEAYRSLLQLDPTRHDAVYGLVECCLQTGRCDEARRVLDEHPDLAATSARWNLLAAATAAEAGLHDQVILHARDAVALDPAFCRARLLLAETLELVGRREQALEQYEWFDRLAVTRLPSDPEGLTAAGRGFYRYSVLTRHPDLTRRTRHVLREMFQAAYDRVDRNYWPARVASADLLREKFNVEDAEEDYRAALLINSSAADAHVGLGRLDLERWDFDAVERRADLALATNPRHRGALVLLAACRIVERRYEAAVEFCDRALSLNPNDVETLALKASALLALGDSAGAADSVRLAEAVSPAGARLHVIVADTLGGLRRFAEAEEHYRRAIELDPAGAHPRTELGLMYMEWGHEDKARETLDAAWRLDPFNARTKNTLELLDNLSAFDTIETGHFVIRFDREQDEVTAAGFADYLESIYDSVTADYGAHLDRKTTIEIFPSHVEFGVRITGRPWIHTVGACTGWVIALDSPRPGGDRPGPYDFADVLKHEFTHTVTLAVTGNRIPHWFTEGLAVLQEDAPKSYEWMELLAEAVRRNDLFSLESIDWGFIRPRKAADRQVAYAQSEWMCEYLIETHGYDVIDRMLRGFRDGRTQADVFIESTGGTSDDFDRSFAAWAAVQAQSWGFDLTPPQDVYKLRAWALANADDAAAHARLARAEYDRQDWPRALQAARRSVELDASGNSLGLEILVRLLGDLSESAPDDAARSLLDDELVPFARQLLEIDSENRFALRALAGALLRRPNRVEALPFLHALVKVWPIDPFAARSLAGIYLERKDFDAALPHLLEAARTDNHHADLPYQIAGIYQRRGQLPDARYWCAKALCIDPFSEPARERLAEVSMLLDDVESAVRQYRTLCRIAPQQARYHAACAFAYHKLGDAENAGNFATRAVELDPDSEAAVLLDE